MKGFRRSPIQMLRDSRTSREDRREAKKQRDVEKHAREAERVAARTAAESRKTNPHGF
jgi:hypothetical protein